MKKLLFVLTMGLLVVLNLNAQNMITEKGYYYSPNGFVCYEGDIYTADMKNMVKSCYPFIRDLTSFHHEIRIPSGAEVIPSHLIYHTNAKYYNNDKNATYVVYIPSSVKYIAVDAFLTPYVKFESGETEITSVKSFTSENKDAVEIARYNMQGIKINRPERGVNIIQMSNRSVQKEYVK